MVIKAIYAIDKFGDDRAWYKVGMDGVTSIEKQGFSPEPFCSNWRFLIHKGNHLYAVINWSAVKDYICEEQ